MTTPDQFLEVIKKLAFERFKDLDRQQDEALNTLLAVSRSAREWHQQLRTMFTDTSAIVMLYRMLDGGATREKDWERYRDRDDQIEKLFGSRDAMNQAIKELSESNA